MTDVRVLSIVPYKTLPAKLGGEKGIALFNQYLGEKIELTCIATENNDVSEVRNYVMLNNLSNNRLRYINPFLYFTVRKLLKQKKATHLLIEHPYYGWLAWLIRKTTPVKWVVHSHNIEYLRSKSIGRWWWKGLKWYERWVYRNTDINFFISEDDLKHAVDEMGIDPKKSFPITYGIEQPSIPDDKAAARARIRTLHGISEHEHVLLFNGALYHHTNYDAVTVITEQINPLLLASNFSYKIIVCGKGLPEFFNELKEYQNKNIIYAGFVDDISLYFKAADIFLNPILAGGGVKTKAIEAIALNCTVVSTETGAVGLKREAAGKKLFVIPDNDWQLFADTVINAASEKIDTPVDFYNYYYWGKIAEKVAGILENSGRKNSAYNTL